MPRKKASKPTIRNRIVEHGEVDPRTLEPNPLNWRTHSAAQKELMRAMLSRVGFVAGVMVNRTTGNLVDGHLRVEVAIEDGDDLIPVDYVELTKAEEALVLAAYDPLSSYAGTDAAAQVEILLQIEDSGDALDAMIRDMMSEAMPIAAAEAALDGMEGIDGKPDPRSWGIGKRDDLVKVVVQAKQLRTIETALQAVGIMNRGDAMTLICSAYLLSMGIDDPATEVEA